MPGLTDDQLLQAISNFRGANAPVAAPPPAQPLFDPATLAAPGPAPVIVPPAQEMAAPPPAVEAALPPSAPQTVVAPPPANSRQALGQMDAAANEQVQATADGAQAQAQANTAEANLIAQQNAQEAAAMAKDAEVHAAGTEKVKGLFDQYQTFKAQNANLQAKDRRTTTQRSLGILGSALGGLADGLSGFSGKNTNFAQNIEKSINEAVDKDIAQQNVAIEGKHRQAAEMLTDLGLARKFFVDDPQAAALYAKAQRKEAYANSIIELSKRSANPKIQADGAAAGAKIKVDSLKDMASVYASKENAIYNAQTANARAAQAVQVQPGNAPIAVLKQKVAEGTATANEVQEVNAAEAPERQETARKEALAARTKAGAIIPDYEPVVPGAPELAPGEMSKAREIAAGVKGVESSGTRLANLYDEIEIAEKHGDSDKADQLRGQYYTTGGQFLTQRSLATGQGVVNQADAMRDAKEGAVPPPPGSGDAAISAFSNKWKGITPSSGVLRQNVKDTMSDGQNKLRAYNLQPAAAKPKPGTVQGIKAGGKAVDASKVIAPDTAPATVMMSLDGVKFFPVAADKVADAKKKFPKAVVKE